MPEITMLEAIREALFEEMERDPAVVLSARISASMAARSRLPRGCWQDSATNA